MSPVWKPLKDPPQLDKFCHLSHDAQRVMLALYSDYLHQRAEIMETKRVMSDSRSYYQSIYEARFGSGSRDDPQGTSNYLSCSAYNLNTPSVSSTTPVERKQAACSSNFQLAGVAARRLDFRHVGERNAKMVSTDVDQGNVIPSLTGNTPAKTVKRPRKISNCLTVSPDTSNYSDSPPVETQDFRILSQFQREDMLGTLNSPSDSSSNNALDSVPAENVGFIDKPVSNIGNNICMDGLGPSSEKSRKPISKTDRLNESYKAVEGIECKEAENTASGSPSLFSQEEHSAESKIVHKTTDRKRVQKHCVTLQKSYESNKIFLRHTFGAKNLSSLTKDKVNTNKVADILNGEEILSDFSKKLVVSPESKLTKKNDVNRVPINDRQTSAEHVHFDFNPNLSAQKVAGENHYTEFVGQSSKANTVTGSDGIDIVPYKQKEQSIDKQLQQRLCNTTEGNPLSTAFATVNAKNKLNSGRGSTSADVEMEESPFMEKPGKFFPIFTKTTASMKDNISSLTGNDQGLHNSVCIGPAKRRTTSSQGFDAPFKKQKKMEHKLDKQISHSGLGVTCINDLPSSELARVLSNCLDADEVVITLVYMDGSTQLRPNLFGQETKKRQSGRQKLAASSVCEVAIGTKSSAYRSVYIFPIQQTNRETLGVLRRGKAFLSSKGLKECQVDYSHFTNSFEDEQGWPKTCDLQFWNQMLYHITTIARDFWKNLLKSQKKKIGFNTKSPYIELMEIFGKDEKEGEWNILDVAVGVWLLDPDKPVTAFEQAVNHLGLPPQAPCDSSIRALPSDMLLLSKVTEKLYHELVRQQLLDVFLCVETPLTPLLAAMEQRQIHVATHTLLKFSEVLKKKLQRLEQQAHQAAGHPFLLNSHAQLRQVLFETLRLDTKLPQKTKLAKTTVGRETSTSEAVLTQLSPHHPLPDIVLEYRQLQKLKSTYIDGILSCVSDGKLQTHWDQTAAATGRLTSYQPNVQAIPKAPVTITNYRDNFIAGKEDQDGMDIYARDCFISRPGYSLLAADFQQIELRLLGHLTRDPALITIFSDPDIPDIFNALTAQWLGKSPEAISVSEREQTKRVVYSVMYGVGKDKLAEYLKISPESAKGIMTSFLVKFPAVNQFTKACVDFCHKHGYTQTIFKRRRLFPNIKHNSPALRAQAERQCVNFCIQGSTADLCKAAMLQVEQALTQRRELDAKLLFQIHDELLFEVADKDLQIVAALVTEVMESRDKLCGSLLTLRVPIPVSVSFGKSWGHMQTIMDKGK